MTDSNAPVTDTRPPGLETVLSLLASRRRRYVLYALSTFTTPVSLHRVAEKVMALEREVVPDEQRPDSSQVYLSLYHVHVPKLEDAEVVTYDEHDDELAWGDAAAEVRTVLEHVARREPVDID